MKSPEQCRVFYKHLFAPIEKRLGAIDQNTLIALMGFEYDGLLNFSTVGAGREPFVTYVSCELALRDGQKIDDTGPYEVMMACNNKGWALDMLTRVGRMSFQSLFAHGHTIDISPVVDQKFTTRGLLVEEFAKVMIDQSPYRLLWFHGITQSELDFARAKGSTELLKRLQQAGVYPNTSLNRESIAL
jgi:hypothetical protein